ncbi:tetratricopeptide repeat protein [Pseudodesulfovibrio sediminis]|uniref:Uncharacterized protein n=1 Tax=Pseudodesulfovibrio sediminis TaxID=2810563 RepID=A0ABM7P1Z7_9BACT|nr:tetratricopeptide repeat protein [Pseudodesulfovibrio sediminis]BCS86775.1 hypothetical protein PSDVSF_00170 [Pseudodesulfovibrio sediminis]
MKKFVFAVLIVSMIVSLAACGAQKTDLTEGVELYKEGNCKGAIPYLDATIANPETSMDMAYAYFLKGQCAEKAGELAKAYEHYYAAKRVTCYEVGNERRTSNNTIARSEYCQQILPKKLTKLAPSVGEEQIQAITAKVDEELSSIYMQRFQKRLSD